MKKRIILLAGIGACVLTLSSCFGNIFNKFDETTRTVFNLTDLAIEGIGTDAAKNRQIIPHKEFKFKVHQNYENILYCDFLTYAQLVANTFTVEGTTYECDGTVFTVSNKDGQLIYAAGVDISKKQLFYGGSLASATTDEEKMKLLYGSLQVEADIQQVTLQEPTTQFNVSSYANFRFPTYYQNRNFIAPLALFDSAFGSSTSLYHFDGFGDMVQYNSFLALSIPMGEDGGAITKPIENVYKEKGMPEDLRLLDKECLYFIMDNNYGLAPHKNIQSMSTYFDNHNIGKGLLSDDPATRCYTIFEAFALLNDDHSGVRNVNPFWGDDQTYNHRGPLSIDRRILSQSLNAQRDAALGTTKTDYGVDEKVHYSTSGDTAYFYFDSFIFDTMPYDEDNRDELWHSDSYFYFLHQFEEIKAHGGVKNVIIDDSCNGGGTVGIADKLLALISKDNYGSSITYDIKTNEILELGIRVDSNQDGKYDKDDVYGDDFKIYILTSPNSFSCGNWFPIQAQHQGTATIIGKKSGGGECVVGSAQLPSGRGIQFSSTNRLVIIEDDKPQFVVEDGATPDINLEYYQFYNIDGLEEAINQ